MRRTVPTTQAHFGWWSDLPPSPPPPKVARSEASRTVLRVVVILGLDAWLRAYLDAHRVPEQGDLLAWRRPLTRPRLPLARVDRGGPDPLKPCEGCRERPTCRAPCQLLTRLLPPDEVRAYNEVSSPALMTGGGHDEAFLTIPAEWADDPNNPFAGTETEDRWRGLLRSHGGKRLLALVEAPGILTPPQREVLGMFLQGYSRKQIGEARDVSRQAIHKIVHAAVRTLRPLLQRPGTVRAVDGRTNYEESDQDG